MLVKIISDYLGTNRRLVIPQLGAFIVKVPFESIIFSEMMKRDDGVLRKLLIDAGMSEIEAIGAIDRFVFEVRHAIQSDTKYVLKGFGDMSFRVGGVIAFEYYPNLEDAPTTELKSTNVVDIDVQSEDEIDTSKEVEPNCNANNTLESICSGKVVDPALKGLCYGKPTKNNPKYTRNTESKKKVDKFLIMAIIAAIIAIAAIAFGYYNKMNEEQQNRAFIETLNSIQPSTVDSLTNNI